MSLPHRRRREGKTDYKKRLKMLISRKMRVIIRKTNRNIIIQFVKYNAEGDEVITSAQSSELKKLGWKASVRNIPSAYLTGLLAGKKAKKANVSDAILDLGLYAALKGSVIYAALKGIVDAGINVPHSPEIFPPAERLSGKHIESNNITKYTKSEHKGLSQHFESIKNKIAGEK